MKATIGVYDSHEEAVIALEALNEAGFPLKNVSFLGKDNLTEGSTHIKSQVPEEVGVGVSLAAGTTIGVLTGLGVLAIPGFGFLYGAGVLAGAFVGFDMGAIGGSLIAVLAYFGVDKEDVAKYESHLKNGKHILIAEGSESELNHAKEVLNTKANHIGLQQH
jgi:hypothetical protein